jgi:DNA (cytosine-5)-methyltransferase 1
VVVTLVDGPFPTAAVTPEPARARTTSAKRIRLVRWAGLDDLAMAALCCGTEPVAESAHGSASKHGNDGWIPEEDREKPAQHQSSDCDTDMNGVLWICHINDSSRAMAPDISDGVPTKSATGLKYCFVMPKTKRLKPQLGRGFEFIDLFAGVGGFHQAFHNLGAKCVFASEWNEAARETYRHNFRKVSPDLFKNDEAFFNRDITEITQTSKRQNAEQRLERIRSCIPDFDVLCAGFPCQPFSQAGHKLGFDDERGNLFYDIEKILEARKPRAIFLENVRHLLKHDNENTIREIRKRLRKAGYGNVGEFVVKASDHGLPQHRPRVFIIGFREESARDAFVAPEARSLDFTMSDVFGGARVTNLDGSVKDIGFTLRVGGKSSPIDDRRNWDGYIVNGKPQRLMPHHGVRMQGFNPGFEFPDSLSHAERMKQLGNSVAVPAVEDYALEIFRALRAVRHRDS